ncbi:MAG: adenylate/guanylate cyclase domain-containing protein [Spirochaetes bacterium]|nr:adenylate/guanylate cyclase domain-containing protein [Spirochaetota bacterium]
MKKPKIIFRFELGFTAFLLFIMILSAMIVYLPWYFTSRKNIKEIVSQVNNELIKGINQKIDTLFQGAVEDLKQIQYIFQKGIIDIENKKEREGYYLSVLKNNPQYSWVVFGWPDGDFLGAQRIFEKDKEYLNIVNRQWLGEERKATKTVDLYDFQLQEKSTRVIEGEDYRVQKRAWYKVAEQQRAYGWTDVYIFSTTRQPGINVSASLDLNGQFHGIMSIAMELNDISNYLQEIRVAKTGTVFLIKDDKKLIAFKEMVKDKNNLVESIVTEDNQLKSIDDFGDNHLTIASQAIADNEISFQDTWKQKQFTHQGEKNGEKYYVSLAKTNFTGWYVGTIIPEIDYLKEIYQNIRNVIMIILGFFVVIVILAIVASRQFLVKPIHQISFQTQEIKNFRLDRIMQIHTNISEINELSQSMFHMNNGLKSFQKYLPTTLVQKLIDQGIEVKLGGEEKELTMYFSDIAAFTKIFQQLGNRLIPYLSEYFGELSKILLDNQGTIDKFIGDAIMAFWGAPVPIKDHALQACRSAIHCQKLLKTLRLDWKRKNQPLFHSRIGINTGVVVVGNIGHENRFDYTVVGDPVNIASRLESLNKYYGTNIIIGEQTYKSARQDLIARKLDTVKLYGADKGLDVYELIDIKEEISVTDKFDWVNIYEQGLLHYRDRKWEKAFAHFMQVKKLKKTEDYPALILAKRCQVYLKNPPPEGWDGITVMDKK